LRLIVKEEEKLHGENNISKHLHAQFYWANLDYKYKAHMIAPFKDRVLKQHNALTKEEINSLDYQMQLYWRKQKGPNQRSNSPNFGGGNNNNNW